MKSFSIFAKYSSIYSSKDTAMKVHIDMNTRNINENTNTKGGELKMDEKTKIIKVRKNSSGDITDVMLQNGNVYSINEAVMMAKDNLIDGVNVGHAKNGREYLRSNPNGEKEDNLDNLETF